MTNRKSHTPFQSVLKSTTYGWPWTPVTHPITQNMRLSEPTTKIWTKLDPYYHWQKCSPMSLLSGSIRFIRIFAELPYGGGVKRQWSCRQRQFSAFSPVISSETLIRSAFSYCDTQCVVGFLGTQNASPCNLYGYFVLNSIFASVSLASDRAIFENNCVKTNEDRPILSAALVFGRDSSFWQYKVCADTRYSKTVA